MPTGPALQRTCDMKVQNEWNALTCHAYNTKKRQLFSHDAALGQSSGSASWVCKMVQHRPWPKALALPGQLRQSRCRNSRGIPKEHVRIDAAHAKGAGACSMHEGALKVQACVHASKRSKKPPTCQGGHAVRGEGPGQQWRAARAPAPIGQRGCNVGIQLAQAHVTRDSSIPQGLQRQERPCQPGSALRVPIAGLHHSHISS